MHGASQLPSQLGTTSSARPEACLVLYQVSWKREPSTHTVHTYIRTYMVFGRRLHTYVQRCILKPLTSADLNFSSISGGSTLTISLGPAWFSTACTHKQTTSSFHTTAGLNKNTFTCRKTMQGITESRQCIGDVAAIAAALRSSTTQQHYAAALHSSTTQQHYAAALRSSTTQQHYAAALHSSTTQQHYAAALRSSTTQQHYAAALRSSTTQQHYAAALRSSTTQQHYAAALRSSTTQQHYATALRSSTKQQHYAAALRSSTTQYPYEHTWLTTLAAETGPVALSGLCLAGPGGALHVTFWLSVLVEGILHMQTYNTDRQQTCVHPDH